MGATARFLNRKNKQNHNKWERQIGAIMETNPGQLTEYLHVIMAFWVLKPGVKRKEENFLRQPRKKITV